MHYPYQYKHRCSVCDKLSIKKMQVLNYKMQVKGKSWQTDCYWWMQEYKSKASFDKLEHSTAMNNKLSIVIIPWSNFPYFCCDSRNSKVPQKSDTLGKVRRHTGRHQILIRTSETCGICLGQFLIMSMLVSLLFTHSKAIFVIQGLGNLHSPMEQN